MGLLHGARLDSRGLDAMALSTSSVFSLASVVGMRVVVVEVNVLLHILLVSKNNPKFIYEVSLI